LEPLAVENKNLPQLYRFCFLMTANVEKAKEAFQGTVREAALRSAHGEAPPDRLWFFRDARGRCLAASDNDLQAEHCEMDEHEVAASAPAQIAQIDVEQLATWICAAPEPQRSAIALHYLDEFNPAELCAILGLKPRELPPLIASGRREFQGWLDAVVPHHDE
jgi:DNA-directed RNA polymerase specialized sigma24 family protein